MNDTHPSQEEQLSKVKAQLKELLISQLALEDITPEEIKDDEPIFGEGLGLDSLDAVEIVVLLQRNFGVTMKETEKGNEIFRSINTLAAFIVENSSKQTGLPGETTAPADKMP